MYFVSFLCKFSVLDFGLVHFTFPPFNWDECLEIKTNINFALLTAYYICVTR